MKRLMIAMCTFLLLAICNDLSAQQKQKEKDNKMKMKDTDMNAKVKVKDDKLKAKEGEDKLKAKTMDTHAAPMAMDMQAMPYTAGYSSNFVIGNPDHSKMILDLWKDWDDNAFDRHDYMADTLVMILSNGQMVKGKDANMEGAKKFRGSMASAKSTLDAWIPLRSVDKNEDWVALWGQEEDVYPDGKKEKREIHEIWRINKDGKVDFMKQFAAVTPPEPGQ